MQKEDLYEWMEHPDKLDDTTLEKLKAVVDMYPCFHTARLIYTKNIHRVNGRAFEEELGKTAILCNDRRKLFYLIYRDEYSKFLDQDEDMQPKTEDRTGELLESFLSSLGERELIDPSIENPGGELATTDYLSYLASVEGGNGIPDHTGNQKLQHHDIIDAFIEKAESDDVLFKAEETPSADKRQDAAIKEEEGEFLTETLARIYIKQKKYEQALTIIKRLSLNFPKKSVYFAHQIRFLELLIANEHFQ